MATPVDPRTVDSPEPTQPDAWWVGLLNLAACLAIYFAVPLDADLSRGRLALNIAVTLVSIGVIAWIVLREARRRTAGMGPRLKGRHLVLLLELVLVAFALVYYMLAVSGTDQIAGIVTRLDALYFATVTMTTVGFGDIVPLSQAARALVSLQLVFNVAFIALVAGLIRQGFQAQVRNASV